VTIPCPLLKKRDYGNADDVADDSAYSPREQTTQQISPDRLSPQLQKTVDRLHSWRWAGQSPSQQRLPDVEIEGGQGKRGEGVAQQGSGDRSDLAAPQKGCCDGCDQHLRARQRKHAPKNADGKAARQMFGSGFEANKS
jgi:hypothetical protein